jgi:cytidylate kinase
MDDTNRRDKEDQTREVAPLQTAPDAITIDSTGLTPEKVVKRMLAEIKGKG